MRAWAIVDEDGQIRTQYPLEGGEYVACELKDSCQVMEAFAPNVYKCTIEPVTVARDCVWRNYPDSRGDEEWTTACDTGPWQFAGGTAKSYEVKFCPGCGGRVVIKGDS